MGESGESEGAVERKLGWFNARQVGYKIAKGRPCDVIVKAAQILTTKHTLTPIEKECKSKVAVVCLCVCVKAA